MALYADLGQHGAGISSRRRLNVSAQTQVVPSQSDLAKVLRATEATLTADSARVLYRLERTFGSWPDVEIPWLSDGAKQALAPAGRLIKAGAKAAWKRATDGADFGRLEGEGFIVPRSRRWMMDYGSYAELFEDDRFWGGRSGRALSTLDPWPDGTRRNFLWLLDALRGVVDAQADGVETVRGQTCAKVMATIDLSKASERLPRSIEVPQVRRFSDLLALPFTVWHDEHRLRRIQYVGGTCSPDGCETTTVELWDYGVATDRLDWSCLPTFRTED
jgi:hypothetical protein